VTFPLLEAGFGSSFTVTKRNRSERTSPRSRDMAPAYKQPMVSFQPESRGPESGVLVHFLKRRRDANAYLNCGVVRDSITPARLAATAHPLGKVPCGIVFEVGDAAMNLQDYKTVLYRQEDGSWVAEIPAIPGCYALMPTREEALAELGRVFEMISTEYREKQLALPADTTEIIHA
jgi:predicted RNase H-like HicB family nuclease